MKYFSVFLLMLWIIVGETNAKTLFEKTFHSEQEMDPRALIFIVRTTSSFAPFANTTVFDTANTVTQYINNYYPGYFEYFNLIGYANGALTYNMEFKNSVDFQNAILTLPMTATTNSECYDSLYEPLRLALTSYSVTKYPKSHIFTFGDNLPNDPTNMEVISKYFEGTYQGGPIFNVIFNSSESNCIFNTEDPAYRQFRNFAKLTHGLVSFLPPEVIPGAAFNFALAINDQKLLSTIDFIDECLIEKPLTTISVGDSINIVEILVTGNSLDLQVLNSNDTSAHFPDSQLQVYGNTRIFLFLTVPNETYTIQVLGADQPSPCQFRIYADSEKSIPKGNLVTYFY